jgi:hypothetical protein
MAEHSKWKCDEVEPMEGGANTQGTPYKMS